jgi:hypothetical protein
MASPVAGLLAAPGRNPRGFVIAQIWYVAFFIAGIIGAHLMFRQL